MAQYQNVEIPENYFFQMARKEYRCWKTALIREFVQNAVDAGASRISITQRNGYLKVEDNGSGMDEGTLLESLLTLGGSKKAVQSVGGLGKAKEILYFSWPEWTIRTSDCLVYGKGGTYNLTKVKDKLNGTRSRIYLGEAFPDVMDYLGAYLNYCSLPEVEVTFNKRKITTGALAEKGDPVTTIDGLGTLYHNKAHPRPQVIVQAHGLFMFSSHGPLDKSYVFDITRPSYDCLTANRNGFTGNWQEKFNQVLVNVAIETQSARLRKEQVLTVAWNKYSKDDGPPLSHRELVESPLGEMAASSLGCRKQDLTQSQLRDFMAEHYPVLELVKDDLGQNVLAADMKRIKANKTLSSCIAWYRERFEEGFILVSEEEITTALVRDLYSKDCLKAAVLWQEIVAEVCEVVEVELGPVTSPGLGIVVADGIEAQCYDRHLLFNPFCYFDRDWDDIAVRMAVSAVHEFVHYLGHSLHNETFITQFQALLIDVIGERISIGDHLSRIRKVRKNG
jgi:hypothetical protein